MDLVKDTYIPIFSNRPEDYREWRTRIVLYKKKLDIQKKSKEACINLMTSLTGDSMEADRAHGGSSCRR